MDWGHLLFSPNGRIGQNAYWIGVLIIVLGNIILPMVPIIGQIAWFVLIWNGIAVYGKRLHDGGKTAWIHAVPWGLNIGLLVLAFVLFGAGLLQLIFDANANEEPSAESVIGLIAASGGALGLMLVGSLIWLGYTIWLGVMDGDPGPNAYGPPQAPPEAV